MLGRLSAGFHLHSFSFLDTGFKEFGVEMRPSGVGGGGGGGVSSEMNVNAETEMAPRGSK